MALSLVLCPYLLECLKVLCNLRLWKVVQVLLDIQEKSCIMHMRPVRHSVSVFISAEETLDFLTPSGLAFLVIL